MSDVAKVDSIDAIKAFRAMLWKFQEAANVALSDAESEVHRTLTWLESEQQQFWSTQIRKRSEWVERCKEAVRMKKIFKDSTGRTQTALDEEKALLKAQKALELAQQKLTYTKQHSRKLVKEFQNYKGAVQRFATAVQADIPVAAAHLDALTAVLDQYISFGVATTGGEASGQSGEASGMTRATGEASKPVGVEQTTHVTDLSGFPEISAPQVVLVHAETDTGVVTLEDGTRYNGSGDRYKIFDSAHEASAYAMNKIMANPRIECVIFAESQQILSVICNKADAGVPVVPSK